jgi:BRCT domain type II-containing protein
MTELTSKQLRQAANIKEKIENLENDLARLLTGTDSAGGTGTKAPRKRRKMSAAARAKISAAAKARWAKVKAGKK